MTAQACPNGAKLRERGRGADVLSCRAGTIYPSGFAHSRPDLPPRALKPDVVSFDT